MLVELSVMEQRYHAVMEVISGGPVAEVARRYGVSRQAVHGWLGRYERAGLAGLADHSHRRPPMPDVWLDASDAAELAEMLQFLTGWLRPRQRRRPTVAV